MTTRWCGRITLCIDVHNVYGQTKEFAEGQMIGLVKSMTALAVTAFGPVGIRMEPVSKDTVDMVPDYYDQQQIIFPCLLDIDIEKSNFNPPWPYAIRSELKLKTDKKQ